LRYCCIRLPVYPVTISLAMKSVKQSSMSAVTQRRGADEQEGRCGLIVERVRMPSDPRARI
jgi:hypothetical protein